MYSHDKYALEQRVYTSLCARKRTPKNAFQASVGSSCHNPCHAQEGTAAGDRKNRVISCKKVLSSGPLRDAGLNSRSEKYSMYAHHRSRPKSTSIATMMSTLRPSSWRALTCALS
jgi:hypothetical protein